MAWQMHYTSARSGPTGRAGFQFVAETPGVPEGVRAQVTPFLSYRPPPDAPLSPDDGELARFPVAFLYDRVGGRPLLLRCRYLGQDYSGRFGNFFAHAVVADPEEMEGVRAAELWQAPLWADAPSDAHELAPLDDLTPGSAMAPEALAEWLASAPGDPYALLTRLVDAVTAVLAQGHGRVVLVASDVELTARWIAVLSYSLPMAAAARMSFVTYSADPDGAAQRLVGTTPDVWAAAQHQGSPQWFPVEQPVDQAPPGGGEESRFARTVARCWREFDFAGLDALGELALLDSSSDLDPGGLERAAGLLALCRGDSTVAPADEKAAAALLARHGTAIPDWVWRDLVAGVPAMGFDLALTIHDWARAAGAADVAARCVRRALASAPDLTEVARMASVAARAGTELDLAELGTAAADRARGGAADVPAALRTCPPHALEPLLSGTLRGLAAADDTVRAKVLTDAACDVLYEHSAVLRSAPSQIVALVLASIGRRHRDRRVAVTGRLVRLGPADAALREIWETPPTPSECLELLDAHPEAVAAYAPLAVLPCRVFARAAAGDAATGGDALTATGTLRLAAAVRVSLPDGRAAHDAALVQAYAEAVTSPRPRVVAQALETLMGGSGGGSRLAEDAFTAAARRLANHRPRFRAALLAAAPVPVRARLGARWTADLPDRSRTGRSPLRGAEIAQRNELVEVVLRLRRRGVPEPGLEAWARAAAAKWISGRQLEAYLAAEPELRAVLRDLLGEGRAGGG
ncbi:hypothetical protein ABZ801_18180 [Actinomadura sp. NPDC047616]|uniref:GAP1-N2 domain-containing protein n=1 Tax=Actinomadura sp. NPDC047616 TaxID=3155914 RepID=UPI0033BFFE38